MGTPTVAAPVKRIVGVLVASLPLLDEVVDAVAASVAPVELASAPEAWTVSRYYTRELGPNIWRQYLALRGVMPADALAALKLETNRLEDHWRDGGARRVNLDPGYVSVTTLVLASTKPAAHRVYLGGGIYAEATLSFVNGSFTPWPYTYADYAAPASLAFFNQVRARYRAETAAVRAPGRAAR